MADFDSKEEKKETSTLKFSDFESSGMQFDHSKKDIFEAMGIGDEERDDLAKCMINAQGDTKTCTEAIEKTLNVDAPTRWKICGLLKVGEKMSMLRVLEMIHKMPDDLPPQLFKMILAVSIMTGKMPPKMGKDDDETEE
jgi:hypothetical protein